MSKPNVYISFDMIPEAKFWRINSVYKVEAVLRQKSMDDKGATFDIVEISSSSPKDKRVRHYLTEGGYQKT